MTEINEVQEIKRAVQEVRSAITPMADRISGFQETKCRDFWRLAIPVFAVIVCVLGMLVFGYFRLSSRHVTFVSEGETKTIIGVKAAGRIQANTDDRTGETIIEVYHAKK